MVVEKLKNNKSLSDVQVNHLRVAGYDVSRLNGGKKLILITGHRRESLGEGFLSMLSAMKSLCEKYSDVDFVYPMHLNPNVRRPIHQVFEGVERLHSGEGWGEAHNFFFIEPLEYLAFVLLMEKSYIVLTDSGGIQEEAPALGKPVLVMRETTERPEAVIAGTVRLVGTDYNQIISDVSRLLDDFTFYQKMASANNPYGDGMSSIRIVQAVGSEKLN